MTILLIHTMTITECEFVIEAQFFHALRRGAAGDGIIGDTRLVGRRLSLRLHPIFRRDARKANLLCRLNVPGVKKLMKRNSAHIRHHVRAIHMYVNVY